MEKTDNDVIFRLICRTGLFPWQKKVSVGFIPNIRYQTEEAVRDYYFATERPSTVALAAIFNTLDQVDQQDHQAILHALLLIMNEEFDSPEDLLVEKYRLQSLARSNDAIVEELRVVSDISPIEVKVCRSKRRLPRDKYFDQ